ncbi:MAG TPA: Plug domain-containing protein, partial [Cyclobacteriaceae bacterium]|nr:Plug domain-containing protein [Cyclobacteriaceae bacterium]
EETRKYAAAVNDPARMVASYAGVVQTSDGNNAISIRGNSPYGLQWRMEGIDIPNPNHFSGVATAGGGISILSTQLLSNSDFITGAFPAEYGNALSGVFDLNLRRGNNEKREYTFQAGVLGIDVAAEGPFSKKYKGSYLINYRYSTLSILSRMGVNIGDGVTNFQDLSYNIYLPTNKAGTFSLFGFGGLSDQVNEGKKDSTKWEDEFDRLNGTYFSNTGAAGLKHSITLGANTYLQSTALLSGNDNGYRQDKLDNGYHPVFDYKSHYINKKITISTVLNHKFNSKNSIRSGVYINQYYFTLAQRERNKETQQIETKLNENGTATTVQVFSQWNYRATEKITLNSGLHFLHLIDNNTSSIEPRASVKYDLTETQSISLGYGLHGQMQPVGIYSAQRMKDDGSYEKPNRNVGFTKAHHIVVAYDKALSQHMRVKAETYYQWLFNVPVKNDVTSPFSSINNEEGYVTDPLVNKGVGRNYGLELTLEQFTHNNLYFLLSTSLYNSEYKALDNVWRNTRYNGNYAFSFTAGKEFPSTRNGKSKVYGINIRSLYSGGLRTTPIDYSASMQAGETKYIESKMYDQQNASYFRTDIRVSMKRNRARTTTTLALDLQNSTNHQNIYGKYFDPQTGKVKTSYQLPLIPVLSYKIEF